MTPEMIACTRHWSNDTRLKLLLILTVVLIDVMLVTMQGLTFPVHHLVRPLGFGAVLIAVAFYYERRGVSTFVLCMIAMLHLVWFTPAYTVLMYAITTTAHPLFDDALVAFDHACGVHLPDILAIASQYPAVTGVLRMCYDTVLFQTAGLVIVLGFLGDRKPLESYILRFMVAALVTAALFWWFPAAGPFRAFGYEPSPDQQRYLEHFDALRSGERLLVTWEGAEGLITFPSFHTTWAVLLALAVRHRRRLFVASALLNGAVILSTLTTGWHYFADVAGGIVTALLAVAVVRALGPWLYPLPRPISESAPGAVPDLGSI